MGKIRRVIRKTRPAGQPAFDEKFWPVILALFVLGGFLLGTVSAYLESSDAPLYANAWTWLIVIPVITCLAIWGLRYVDSRSVRRGVQFSAILCVVVHLLLFIAAMETDIFGRFWEELANTSRTPQPPQPVVEPVYEPVQLERQDPSQQLQFRPVETELPDPMKSEVSRKEQPQRQPQATFDPSSDLPADPQIDSSLTRRQQSETTVPRHAEQLGKLSRQQANARPQTESAAESVERSAEQMPRLLSPKSRTIEARVVQSQLERRELSPSSEPQPVEQPARLERSQAAQSPPADRVASRPVPRSTAAPQPRAAPPVEIPRNESQTSQQLQARATATRPAATVAPPTEQPREAPAEAQSIAGGSAERAERSERPLVPTVAAPRPARRVSAPHLARAARLEAVGTVATRDSNVRPQTPSMQRAADATSAQADTTSTIDQVPNQPAARENRAQPLRAAATETVPTASVAGATTSAVARSSRLGAFPTPRQVQEAAAIASSQVGPDNVTEPARTALARSLSGSAGVGQSPNLDRAFPAADSPAMIASGAARRANATQQMPAGAALAPSAPAVVRHSVADARRPGATLRATTPDHAPERGAAEPSELNATASAAPRRAASDADPGTVTASAGAIDVDMGPTRIVAGGGRSRAAGGGQPELQTELAARDLARRRPTSPPTGTLSSVDEPAMMAPSETAENRDSGAPTPAAANIRVGPAGPAQSQSAGTAAPTGATVATAPPSVARSKGLAGAGDQAVEEGAVHRTRRSREIRGPQLDAAGPLVALDVGSSAPASDVNGNNADRAEHRTSAARSFPSAALALSQEREVRQPSTEPSSAGGLPGIRRSPGAASEGPRLAGSPAARVRRRPAASRVAGGPVVAVDTAEPKQPERSEEDPSSEADMLPATSAVTRSPVGPVATNRLELDPEAGPGGIGVKPSLDVGIRSRRASRDSLQVELRPGRFRRRRVSGIPGASPSVVVATDSFRRREDRVANAEGRLSGALGPESEKAIELGLAFLARYQRPDGSWSLQSFDEDVALGSDTAATGLALLAFQGAGYNHREHRYADVVAGAIDYLTKNQQENGDLFIRVDNASNTAVWLYSHGIAALAMSEAYGMTQDPELAQPAQNAIDFIVSSQDKRNGGWRYRPGFSSDTSVTGWMVMALRSAELANLEVPDSAHTRVRKWLDLAQASRRDSHLYRYNPFAPDTPTQRHGLAHSPTMTSVGLLMRLYDGWRRDQDAMRRGGDYLLQHLPARGTRQRPQRDTYYWYYGTQVMFHMGGDYWQQWNGQLHPMLIENQVASGRLAGSWDPNLPVPDRWAPHAGRLYVTALNLLSLEVFYRHLPLYDDTLYDGDSR